MWWRRGSGLKTAETLIPELPSSSEEANTRSRVADPQTVISQWYMESCLLLTNFGPEEVR